MRNQNSRLLLVGALGLIPALLTSCPRPPYYGPGVSLLLSLPDAASTQSLKVVGLYYEVNADGMLNPVPRTVGYGYFQSSYGSTDNTKAVLNLDGYTLTSLANNDKCVTPFKTGEAANMKSVTISVDTVKTCNIYFVAYADKNGDNFPTREEEQYITHDLYGYATDAFTYSMTTQDGKTTESGSRAQGWSLVRHTVLQPTSTPGQYQVSMNSVPGTDEGMAIRLHEPTDYLTSMSVGGAR